MKLALQDAIALLAEPIKAEFALSDTAIGLLFGLFFTGSFVLAVLPLARLADMGFRREVIGCCVLVWSSIFAACLLARSYAALVVARVGIGASLTVLDAALQILADGADQPGSEDSSRASRAGCPSGMASSCC